MLEQALRIRDEIIRLRRDFHRHPELSFQEFRTAKVVADMLAEIGIEDVRTNVGRTGVVAQIGPSEGPTIAIRADMDALPIEEAVEIECKSQNPGVMHACGHDAHTAILLGVAHLLHESFAEEREQWQGNVRLLFQPSEEFYDDQGVSGATAMIADGAMEGVDHMIALHMASTEEAGKIIFHDGYSTAATDRFEAWVRASGGHGAYPHKAGDPIFMLSAILPMIYGIPSRRIDPLKPCVISLGEVRGGSAFNVIPSEIYLRGTVRTMSPHIREQVEREIEECFKLATAMGGSYEYHLDRGYPSLYNAPGVNDWMRSVTRDLLGDEVIVEQPTGMAGEDFAYMAEIAPGAMFSLGAKVEGGGDHHTPLFAIDEETLPLGAAVLAETARRFVMGELREGN